MQLRWSESLFLPQLAHFSRTDALLTTQGPYMPALSLSPPSLAPVVPDQAPSSFPGLLPLSAAPAGPEQAMGKTAVVPVSAGVDHAQLSLPGNFEATGDMPFSAFSSSAPSISSLKPESQSKQPALSLRRAPLCSFVAPHLQFNKGATPAAEPSLQGSSPLLRRPVMGPLYLPDVISSAAAARTVEASPNILRDRPQADQNGKEKPAAVSEPHPVQRLPQHHWLSIVTSASVPKRTGSCPKNGQLKPTTAVNTTQPEPNTAPKQPASSRFQDGQNIRTQNREASLQQESDKSWSFWKGITVSPAAGTTHSACASSQMGSRASPDMQGVQSSALEAQTTANGDSKPEQKIPDVQQNVLLGTKADAAASVIQASQASKLSSSNSPAPSPAKPLNGEVNLYYSLQEPVCA